MKKLDPLYDYYQREMAYLRQSGSIFAEKFPKIARRLQISSLESADPHVERLLESFAYLTARLQRDTDDQFPHFTRALLGVLYPQFIHPLPPYTIACFEATGIEQLTTPYKVPKKTALFTRSKEDHICRFQTVYDLEVAPIIVKSVNLLATMAFNFKGKAPPSQRVLKISLECTKGTFQSLGLSSLRFYLAGGHVLKHHLYEGIMKPEGEAWAISESMGEPYSLGADAIKPVGFSEDESMFPYPSQAHPGYRLLLEYFYYPQKFMFIDVLSKGLCQATNNLDILIPFSEGVRVRSEDVSPSNFLLGCVPIINLFSKVSEPLILDRRTVEYRLNPDLRHELTTEIYDVQEVLAAVEGKRDTLSFRPYFSHRYQGLERQDKTFWHMRRTPSNRLEMPGTDIYLSFVDFNFDPLAPPGETVYAKILCTNRHLATHIPVGTALYAEEKLPFSSIHCLKRPTSPIYPPTDGTVQWQIISQLSLNHLGLTGGAHGLEALKEFMRLYGALDQQRILPELDMVTGLDTKTIVRRFGTEAWRGFAEGTQIKLTFDPQESLETSIFLFAMLLNHVFPMFASMTSFTELEIYKTTQEGPWKQWKPRAGSRVLL